MLYTNAYDISCFTGTLPASHFIRKFRKFLIKHPCRRKLQHFPGIRLRDWTRLCTLNACWLRFTGGTGICRFLERGNNLSRVKRRVCWLKISWLRVVTLNFYRGRAVKSIVSACAKSTYCRQSFCKFPGIHDEIKGYDTTGYNRKYVPCVTHWWRTHLSMKIDQIEFFCRRRELISS